MTRQQDIVQLLSIKHPRIVMNLLSALQFHQMTTQIPQSLFLAIPRGTWAPKVSFCQVELKRLFPPLMDIGVETHQGEFGGFKIFNPERCLVDIFKYRREFGQDVFLEVLQEYRKRKHVRPLLLAEYAEHLRVFKSITPYLEMSV